MSAGGIDDRLHDLSLYIKHGILKLQETWKEIGLAEEEQAGKCESVVTSLRSVLDSLVIGERAWKESLEEECQELSGKCNESFRQLGLPAFDPDSVTLALLCKQEFLTNKSRELEEEILRKQAEIEELELRKIACIKKLGLQPDHYPCIQSDNTGRIISLLQIQIKEFEEDMGRRTKCLEEQLSTLTSLMDNLEIDRCGLIEEGLISEDPDTLMLSDDSIQRRYDLISKYRSELEAKREESGELKRKIERLHRILNKDKILTPDVTERFSCCKPSSIAYLRKILSQLEEKKETMLEEYVGRLKEEIKTFEILCFQTQCELSTSEETCNLQTSSTEALDLPEIILDDIENKNTSNTQSTTTKTTTRSTTERSNTSSDETCGSPRDTSQKMPDISLLPVSEQGQRLENELEAWESFYHSNSVIFDMIKRWKDLNDRYLELSTPTPDKYNNRGGSLLQSQKEAAKITKEIPKLEAKILAEVDKLGDGEVIKVNGLSLEDYFSEYRTTTTLSRLNSLRSSSRKTVTRSKKPSTTEESPGAKLSRARPGSMREKPASPRNFQPRRSMRKRVSRDGLDKIG